MSVCLSRAISPRRSEFESQRAVFISSQSQLAYLLRLLRVKLPFPVADHAPGCCSQTSRTVVSQLYNSHRPLVRRPTTPSIRVDLTQLVRTSTQREHQVKRRAALEGVFFRGLVVGPTVQKEYPCQRLGLLTTYALSHGPVPYPLGSSCSPACLKGCRFFPTPYSR